MRSYARPQTLDDALGLIAQRPHRILAGGTDLYPGAADQLAGDVLDVSAIPGLTGISGQGDLRIGACTTWSMLAEMALPPALAALQQAATQVGGRQIQNVGTLGGNLCNASPAADGVPPLLAVDARVELASARGLRQLALAEFLTGPRQTLRAADEVLVAIIIPEAALRGRSVFHKLGARAYLVISIVMVAARVEMVAGRITDAAIAVGACSGVATRLSEVEAALIGATVADAPGCIQAKDLAHALAPIDDVRATAVYRQSAAVELVRRAVQDALT